MSDNSRRKENKLPDSVSKERVIDDPTLLVVKAPGFLSKEAKEVWNQLVEPLQKAGLLTALDVMQFANYCQWAGRVLHYERKMQKAGGSTTKNSNNTETVKTDYKLLKDAVEMADKLASGLGLTPKSRKSIGLRIGKTGEGKARDSRAAILSRRS